MLLICEHKQVAKLYGWLDTQILVRFCKECPDKERIAGLDRGEEYTLNLV